MKIENIPLKEKDGQVALLIHSGYGGFWSMYDPRLAADARIIEYWEAHKDNKVFMEACRQWDSNERKEVENFLESLGYKKESFDVYAFDNALNIKWVPKNSRFIITEYDGYESVLILGPDYGNTFG